MADITRKDRDRLETVAWGEEHFGSLATNRQFRRRDMLRLASQGLVESVGFVELCDGDGFLVGGRMSEGFRLTAAGRAALGAQEGG